MIKKTERKYINMKGDYKSSMQLDLYPDSSFKYIFHHSLGSCYAKGIWKNNQDTIFLIKSKKKNYSDSFELHVFPNFMGKDKWLVKTDTLYLLDKSKLTYVKLLREL